jgi:anaerobic selenocysteine-containing dehydrogenase
MATTTRFVTCPLCEACCGLAVEVEPGGSGGDRVTVVRPDPDDVFSGGFACPKGLRLADLHHDPERLRTPLVDGEPVSWEQAWQAIHERVTAFRARHGQERMATYLGNPNSHHLAGLIYGRVVLQASGSPALFSASTSDQMPKQVAALLMYGTGLSVAVPDLDRTNLFLVLGGDPLTSNGSMMTAPGMPGLLRALRHRGGRLIVADPRTSRTARAADQHLAIRPGTDALLLAALVQVILAEHLDVPVGPHIAGRDQLDGRFDAFTPKDVAGPTGLDAAVIRQLARELAAAPSAAVYGRMGASTVSFGTLGCWLIDVLNVLTGNLDRPGGVMFPLGAAGQANSDPAVSARPPRFGRTRTQVRGLPEVLGELPTAALAEEILGGHLRGLITMAGNPALSVPDGAAMEQALASLDLMISIDVYRNETTRHAGVVLPAPGPLAQDHFDLVFTQLSIRNHARFSPAAVTEDLPPEWETRCRLAGILAGLGPDADPAVVDDLALITTLTRSTKAATGPVSGRDPAELAAMLGDRRGELRMLDALLRLGPYGDGFGAAPEGLTLDRLATHEHGLDLGPLQPRLPGVLRTVSGQVELAPQLLVEDLDRLRASLSSWTSESTGASTGEPGSSAGPLHLVGRRHLRSNNSWGHNVAGLVGGSNTCTLQMHPDDAAARGLVSGDLAKISSHTGALEAQIEVTDRIRPGVVSLPHGWGHRGTGTSTAEAAGGVNVNVLTPPEVDPLSGNAVLNGYRVQVHRIQEPGQIRQTAVAGN